jgi:hypothetical protein
MADEPTTPATQPKIETPPTETPPTETPPTETPPTETPQPETPQPETPQPGIPAAGSTASPLPPVPAPNLDTGYTDAGVPTLEGVREKIETRYGTALGATELAEETPEVRTAAEQYEAQHKAAAEKLEEIRASMRKPE